MATKTRAKFDIKTVQAEAARPLLASVGVTDLAVEAVRDYVTGFDLTPKALREQAVTVVATRVDNLQKDAKARRKDLEKRVAGLQADALAAPARVQRLVESNVAAANETYGELIKRGESLVGRIRKQESTRAAVASAHTTVAKAKATKTSTDKTVKATRTAATKSTATAAKRTTTAAKKRATTARTNAKGTVTAAKKTASATTTAATQAAAKVGD